MMIAARSGPNGNKNGKPGDNLERKKFPHENTYASTKNRTTWCRLIKDGFGIMAFLLVRSRLSRNGKADDRPAAGFPFITVPSESGAHPEQLLRLTWPRLSRNVPG